VPRKFSSLDNGPSPGFKDIKGRRYPIDIILITTARQKIKTILEASSPFSTKIIRMKFNPVAAILLAAATSTQGKE
jgi:hypothetical protein